MRAIGLISTIFAVLTMILFTSRIRAQTESKAAMLDENGVYHLPAFLLPPSEFTSEEAKHSLIEGYRAASRVRQGEPSLTSENLLTKEKILIIRHAADALRKKSAEDMMREFPVSVTPQMIAGVQTDIVIPPGGVPSKNAARILINLHGGGMIFGARYEGQMAAIPIASLGGFKVITVDYRMAPEYQFPAASEDVAKVYRELLKRYSPGSIGIYGCSAGAALTAQSVAWFQFHDLPNPGAISLDGGAAVRGYGDSAYLAGAFMFGIPIYPPNGSDTSSTMAKLYLGSADPKQPLVSPALHPNVIGKFPPTLIINSTRDPGMSRAVYTHTQLVKAGVEADLHIWEGMGHCFSLDPHLPESREAYDVVIKFFDSHLAKSSTHGSGER